MDIARVQDSECIKVEVTDLLGQRTNQRLGE